MTPPTDHDPHTAPRAALALLTNYLRYAPVFDDENGFDDEERHAAAVELHRFATLIISESLDPAEVLTDLAGLACFLLQRMEMFAAAVAEQTGTEVQATAGSILSDLAMTLTASWVDPV